MGTSFLIHHPSDTVGVATTEIQPGETVRGVVQETGDVRELPALDLIPLGHKIALEPIPEGGTVVKYGVPIGAATRAIEAGQHVHVHNLKSARWA